MGGWCLTVSPPPATREDVAAWYADALSVEAEEVMS